MISEHPVRLTYSSFQRLRWFGPRRLEGGEEGRRERRREEGEEGGGGEEGKEGRGQVSGVTKTTEFSPVKRYGLG